MPAREPEGLPRVSRGMLRTVPLVLTLAACSEPTLELTLGAAPSASSDEWITSAIATDELGNPGRGEVVLSVSGAVAEVSRLTLLDGVAAFPTRCDGACTEPVELVAQWNGQLATRRRTKTRLSTDDGWMVPSVVPPTVTPPPPTIPGCPPLTPCVDDGPFISTIKKEPPCVETSLGGTFSLHLVIRGAPSNEPVRVTLSNATTSSCREGVVIGSDPTFFGIAEGRWTIRVWSLTEPQRTGSGAVTVTNQQLVTEASVLVR